MNEKRNLTAEEILHLNQQRTCPLCGNGALLEGPRAAPNTGGGLQARCAGCGQEFRLNKAHSLVVYGRLLDSDTPQIYQHLLHWPGGAAPKRRLGSP